MKTMYITSGIRKFKTSTTLVAALTLMATATGCRKDDDGPKVSPQVEVANETATPIPDATGGGGPGIPIILGVLESSITIPASGTIKDLSKMFVEINVAHTWSGDLSFALRAPDGTQKDFVYRVCNNGNFVDTNTYRFSSAFTNTIADTSLDIPAGDYKESKGIAPAYNSINLEPIFSSFNGKQVNGTWKLIISDHEPLISGNLIKWKLRFAEGALNQ